MSETAQALILTVCLLATSIWIGGYVAIGVVARTAVKTLDPANRVAFFRTLGRSYLWVGTPALIVAYISGAVLVRNHDWDGTLISTTVIAVLLLLGLAIAVVQARRMTRLRHEYVGSPNNGALAEEVRRNGKAATVLRAALGLLSIALVVLGAFLAS